MELYFSYKRSTHWLYPEQRDLPVHETGRHCCWEAGGSHGGWNESNIVVHLVSPPGLHPFLLLDLPPEPGGVGMMRD